jgi:hypothetical protein
VLGTVIDRRCGNGENIPLLPSSNTGERPREEAVPRRGTASPARAKLLRRPCSNTGATPSVSLWISAPCYGEAGVSRSAFTRRFIDGATARHIHQPRGCCGSGLAEPTPAFSLALSASTDAVPLDLHCLASLKSGAHRGLAMRTARTRRS